MLRLQSVLLFIMTMLLSNAAFSAGSCSFLTADGSTLVDFQTLSSLQSPADGQGQVTVSCTLDLLSLSPAVNYQLKFDGGVAGSFSSRTLKHSSGASLEYNIYLDSQRTQILGDGTLGTVFVSGNCFAACVPIINVYGRIFSNQWGPGGIYRDTINVTLEFN